MSDIQIIRSPSGEELVVLPKADYEALLAAAASDADEDAEDVAMYDARKAALTAGQDGALPEEVSLLIIRGNSRLKAVRMWRKLLQSELAEKAGIGQGYLSDLESGRRAGSEDVLRSLAACLDVPMEWIAG